MPKLRITLAQMNVAHGDVRRNTAAVEKLVAEAARRGSHILLLPELWHSGYDLENAATHAAKLNSGVFTQVSTLAQQNNISILGSVLETRALEVNNSAVFFASNGRSMGVYRKLHLFKGLREDQFLAAGAAPLVMDLPWGSTGIAICYDLRFPELFRRYASEGAKLVLVVAQWPQERIEHWRTLLRARAIENQCYMVACNAAGPSGESMVNGGFSAIIDPWGHTVIEAGAEPQTLTADVEMDMVDEVRRRLPVLADRRADVM